MTGPPLPDRRLLAPALVGALLVASAVAAALVWSAERDDAERANEALARQAAAVAERTVELTAASLRGGAGVLRRSGPMPERGFRRYARDIVRETPIPVLVWAPRVPAHQRARFERVLGRPISERRDPTRRHPKGDLRPAPRQESAHLPIRYVHPDERGPRRTLGLDLLSEPARALAARTARNTDRAAMTRPLLMPGRSEPIVIIMDAVYEPGSRLATNRQRRLALAGIISGSIAARTIDREITQQLGPGIQIAIGDGETTLVERSADANAEGETAMVEVLGNTWTVWVAEIERAAVLPALAVGGVGAALAALVAALFALAGRRELMLSRERDIATAEAVAQRTTASTLQEAFLPPTLPRIEGVEAAAMYAPGAEGLQVGGDFYDLFATEDRWIAMIGDVSGKGARAASLTALVRHTARAVADRGPVAAARELNTAIERETPPGTFATLCIAALRAGDGIDVEIVVAGHPPPLLVRAGGVVEPIQPTGPLVGVLDSIDVRPAHARLARGESLFLYTDGLIEAHRKGGDALGEAGLIATLADARDGDPHALITAALARAREVSPDFPQDDVAILAILATR